MPTLDKIKKVMKKLEGQCEEGEVKYEERRGGENRFTYHYKGKHVFTFGLTRSSRAKSKKFYYVPKQMFLSNHEFSQLVDCPMSKRDYNKLLAIKLKIF